jgi:DNA-binding response OmpR family regulator
MNKRILIVEDQFLIAMAIEDAVLELGHHVSGIAASRRDVERIDGDADIAFVDVNLLDGPTGPLIGRDLAAKGCCVIFMTANPEAVANGIEGTLGVISKPVRDLDLISAIEFASCRCEGRAGLPPRNMKLFSQTMQ